MADTVIYGTSGNDTIPATTAGTSNGSLILTLSGTIAQGELPMFNVLINGVVVRTGVVLTADSLQHETQQVYVALPEGTINSVQIDYTNDPQTDYTTQDRNIYIHSATLNGTNLPVASALYTRDGYTGPHNAEDGATMDGREDMNWGGEMTWSGSLVQNATAGSGGSILIDAGVGLDTVTFAQARSDYTIGHTSTGFSITPTAGGTTTFFGSVERLSFGDGTHWAIDMDGSAGTAAKMMVTLLGQEFLANEALAGLFMFYLDQGMSAETLAGHVVASAEYQAYLGGSSNSAYVYEMYSNLAGSPPSNEDMNYLVGLLDSGAITKAGMTVIAMEHDVVELRTMGVMNGGLEYDPY
jgi:hypothetical protein